MAFIKPLYSQNIIDEYDGPVNFIKELQVKHKEEGEKSFKYQLTKGLIVNPQDRFYMRMKSEDSRCRLFLTKYSTMKNYLNVYDTIKRYNIIRMSGFKVADTVTVWGEEEIVEDWFPSNDKPDPNDNYGLYVMHYQKLLDNYKINWPLYKRVSYMLNHFYADAVFLVNKKIDSTESLNFYSLDNEIKEGYTGYASIEKSQFDPNWPWSCRTLGWFSPVMTKEQTQIELDTWKKEFQTIKNASYDDGGLAYGLRALSYIIPVKKELCKFPESGICQGGLSKADGRISIRIVPVLSKNPGHYQLHLYIKAI
jgi:hypothetical protein